MKRFLSTILALALGLGSVPAQAQVALGRAVLQPGLSAPVPLPSSFAPAAAFSLSLSAPALSMLPAAYAPMPELPLAAPALAPLPVLAPSAIAPVSSIPARVETPLETLRVAASRIEALDAGAAFDGAAAHPAAASVEPPVDPASAAAPVKRGLLRRYMDSRKNTPPLQTAFGRGLLAAAMAAAVAPALLGMAPALKIAYAIPAADLLAFAIIAPLSLGLWAWRKLRGPQTAAKPPPRVQKLAIMALGAILGLGLGITPYLATGPVAQRVEARLDLHRTAEEQSQARWIPGGAVQDETIKVLSANLVGRETLDRLRDRFGMIRLPTFFISKQQDSYAEHENFFDGVYLNESEIIERGWTVEQFLKDPALQRRLIREMDSTVLHELTHAVQGRRAPWRPSYFKSSIEAEQEAFLQETLYRLAQLEGDVALRNNGHDQWMLPDAAASLDGFLKEVAGMYEKNVVVGTDPDYNAYFAAQRARWPAMRVRIYATLAARANTPGMAKMYMDKARAAAKEAGLPEPSPLVASR